MVTVGQYRPVRREAGCDGERGAQRGCWEEGWEKRGCREGIWGSHRERLWPARPPERGVRTLKGAHPILWNHFQKLTDLSASPGMSQTVSETFVRLCRPGWSGVPGEKMLSGKILGFVLWKQTNNTDSQETGCEETHHLPCSLVVCPAKGHIQCFLEGCLGEEGWCPFWSGSSTWPSSSCSHQPSL